MLVRLTLFAGLVVSSMQTQTSQLQRKDLPCPSYTNSTSTKPSRKAVEPTVVASDNSNGPRPAFNGSHVDAANKSSQAVPGPPSDTPGRCENVSKPLIFNAQGNFKISIFEDLHFGENSWDAWGREHDRCTVRVMNTVLDSESPGLVVFNGDLFTGENLFRENSTAYVEQLTAPVRKHGPPWASTYVNHDHDFNLSAAAILQQEMVWLNALTRSMVPGRNAGVSNYFLPVYRPGCTPLNPLSNSPEPCSGPSRDRLSATCAPSLLLWFFDSRGGKFFNETDDSGDSRKDQPSWVDRSVVDWFKSTSSQIRENFGQVIPSLAFTHIPTSASSRLQESRIDPLLQPGMDRDNPLSSQGQGWCDETTQGPKCNNGGQDLPFLQALMDTPGLSAIFSGHDHGVSWCAVWAGLQSNASLGPRNISLCFGQHTGYGGYSNWIRGSRQVQLSLSSLDAGIWDVDTWIRLENKEIIGNVSLDASYGSKAYPPTSYVETSCNVTSAATSRGPPDFQVGTGDRQKPVLQ